MSTTPEGSEYKQIEFEYRDAMPCQLESRWKGCCCVCKNRMEAFKHCCHSPSPDSCACSETLGFYLCCVFVNYDGHWERRVNLCGEHGYCEMFEPIPRRCETCARGPKPNLESYTCRACVDTPGLHAWRPRSERGSCVATETQGK